MEQSRNTYRVLVGRSEEDAFREAEIRWEDNIKLDLKEVGCILGTG